MEETILTLTANRFLGTLAISALLAVSTARAQKAYGPGASDTEIKLGQSTPLSGPASAFGAGAESGCGAAERRRLTELDLGIAGPGAISLLRPCGRYGKKRGYGQCAQKTVRGKGQYRFLHFFGVSIFLTSEVRGR